MINNIRAIADFEKHERCFLIWPYRKDLWKENLKNVRKIFIELVILISKYENVVILVNKNEYVSVQKIFSNQIELIIVENDDIWIRDTGPIFIKENNEVKGISFKFNGWGNLYKEYKNDNKLAYKLFKKEKIKILKIEDLVLEGGAIQTNGAGTAILSESSVLDLSRNPNLNKKNVENILKNNFGFQKIIWVREGLKNDETNGHIDNVLQFCTEDSVVMSWTENKSNPNYNNLSKIYETLIKEKIIVHKVELPNIMSDIKVPATYINFYIANDAIILPIFNDSLYDNLALEKIQKAFPNRKIETIYTKDLLLGGGNIHCMTLGQPK